MKHAVGTFLVLLALWLLWSGHLEPLLVGSGVLSCGLAVWLGRRLGVLDRETYPFHLTPGLLTFVPWLLFQIVKANIDVARLILSPRLPISPRILRVRASQKTVIGQVIHANTITITPGTVSLDLRHDTILIHALTAEMASDDSTGPIDARISKLEGTTR